MSGSVSFDRAAGDYDRHRGGLARGVRQSDVIRPHLDLSRPALEVGIGTGTIAQAMRALGVRLVGIDLAPKMAAQARARVGDVVCVADAERLPFADASFPQVYTVWVLHRVREPLAVLREIARVLEPGGVYVDIPSSPPVAPDAIGQATAGLGELQTSDGWWDEADLARVAETAGEAGLEVTHSFEAPEFTMHERPSEVVERIESRAFSWLWDVDEERWSRIIEPVLSRLRELPDAPVARVGHDRVLKMRKSLR